MIGGLGAIFDAGQELFAVGRPAALGLIHANQAIQPDEGQSLERSRVSSSCKAAQAALLFFKNYPFIVNITFLPPLTASLLGASALAIDTFLTIKGIWRCLHFLKQSNNSSPISDPTLFTDIATEEKKKLLIHLVGLAAILVTAAAFALVLLIPGLTIPLAVGATGFLLYQTHYLLSCELPSKNGWHFSFKSALHQAYVEPIIAAAEGIKACALRAQQALFRTLKRCFSS